MLRSQKHVVANPGLTQVYQILGSKTFGITTTAYFLKMYIFLLNTRGQRLPGQEYEGAHMNLQ